MSSYGLSCYLMIVAALGLSCQKRPHVNIIVEPQPASTETVEHAENTVRSLYQSFWTPPSNDEGEIMVGLISSAPHVRFQSKQALKIRVHTGEDFADISSPPSVVWQIKATELIRKATVTYLPVVEVRLFPRSNTITSSSQSFWKQQGFEKASWIGPETEPGRRSDPNLMQRWVLALTTSSGKKEAVEACAKARKINGFCKVIARTQVAPRLKGVVSTQDGSFSTEFDGFVEIISPNVPVELIDFVAEPRVDKKSNETYLTPLYFIPLESLGVSLVQRVSLKDYLNTVVPSEIFPNASLEAVKAQAVVARTYFLRHLSEDASAHPYSICASTLCQVYRGIDILHPNSSRAVEETNSMILWSDEGQPAETFYHGICGGMTEEKSSIWGPPSRTYLQGVSDAKQPLGLDLSQENGLQDYFHKTPNEAFFCGSSKYTKLDRWRWTKTLDEKFILELLTSMDLKAPLTDIRILKRGRSGRALSMQLTTFQKSKVIHGELNIRKRLGGLLSSMILIQPIKKGDTIVSLEIMGGGYGHGVGLCQVGAIGRAEHGQSFQEILQAYYPGSFLAPMVIQ